VRRSPPPASPFRSRRAACTPEGIAAIGCDIGPDAEVGGLALAVQRKTEIARALFRRPRVLLLDEPASTLSGRERRA
jgi:ribose transport system ATP-binding protein